MSFEPQKLKVHPIFVFNYFIYIRFLPWYLVLLLHCFTTSSGQEFAVAVIRLLRTVKKNNGYSQKHAPLIKGMTTRWAKGKIKKRGNLTPNKLPTTDLTSKTSIYVTCQNQKLAKAFHHCQPNNCMQSYTIRFSLIEICELCWMGHISAI